MSTKETVNLNQNETNKPICQQRDSKLETRMIIDKTCQQQIK